MRCALWAGGMTGYGPCMNTSNVFALSLATLLFAGCTGQNASTEQANDSPAESTALVPADAFFMRLEALCGKAFAGKLVAFEEADLEGFGGAAVMHVRDCSATEIRIPFHVGEDQSRTWVVTRTANGLRLKHDHRHPDGSPDTMNLYGGDSVGEMAGSASRQEFPVDAESRAMFAAGGLTASLENTWAIEIEPERVFAYELRRPGRHFRVEFDLGTPVAEPPAPWGSEVTAVQD